MARPPKPWFWKRRKAWFVTIDGTRHFLATKLAKGLVFKKHCQYVSSDESKS